MTFISTYAQCFTWCIKRSIEVYVWPALSSTFVSVALYYLFLCPRIKDLPVLIKDSLFLSLKLVLWVVYAKDHSDKYVSTYIYTVYASGNILKCIC